jgi:hypothetical protein
LLDDLGAEQQIKHFEMIATSWLRYSSADTNSLSKTNPSHITTNLSASGIENNYGNRLI